MSHYPDYSDIDVKHSKMGTAIVMDRRTGLNYYIRKTGFIVRKRGTRGWGTVINPYKRNYFGNGLGYGPQVWTLYKDIAIAAIFTLNRIMKDRQSLGFDH